MTPRPPELQSFIDRTREAIARHTRPGEPAAAAAGCLFAALERPAANSVDSKPRRLPACRYLAPALNTAQTLRDITPLAAAFALIEPGLAWFRRPSADAGFSEGHANAYIIGPGGIEPRDDAMIGVSLIAPAVQYPDHHHPPEEVYAVLSPGQWRQNDGPWHEPGPGGIVYNPPNIVHAMRSGAAPLLAIWCLWNGRS